MWVLGIECRFSGRVPVRFTAEPSFQPLIFVPFISYPINLPETSRSTLSLNGELEHICLIPNFSGTALQFSPFSMTRVPRKVVHFLMLSFDNFL